MNQRNVPINKGNYSMDTAEREALFEQYRGAGWEEQYAEYRHKLSEFAQHQQVSDYPLLVDIELSSLCNLTCLMCYTITNKLRSKLTVPGWTGICTQKLFTKLAERSRPFA